MPNITVDSPGSRTAFVLAGLGVPAGAAVCQIEFREADRQLLAAGANGVVATDMNGDGWLDLAVCERIETVSVFLNQRDGSLGLLGSVYHPGTELTGIQSADFNGDGHLDLVWIQSALESDSLQVMYGRGDGAGRRLEAIPLPRRGGSLAVGDLTGDHFPDVVVIDARTSGAEAHVFHNQNGRLELAESVSLPYWDNRSVVIGDLDGDGDQDFAALSLDNYSDYLYGWKLRSSDVRIFWNDGTGAFPDGHRVHLPYGGGGYGEDPMPTSLLALDIEGDGDPDLVVGSVVPQAPTQPIVVLTIENRFEGTQFIERGEHLVGSAISSASMSAGDLDTDGDIDLLVKGRRDVWLLESNDNFSFQPARTILTLPTSGWVVTLADLDGNGQFDALDGGENLTVFVNVTLHEGPTLEHGTIKRGQSLALTCRGAQPHEQVHFLYSTGGAGNSLGVSQLGYRTLDLVDPFHLIGSAVADVNGVAELTITVPPNAPLTTVAMQAVIRRGPGGVDSIKTPFRTDRVSE